MAVTKLKLARVSADLIQLSVYRPARVSAGRYSMAERGLIELTDDEKKRIARVLHANPADLFDSVTVAEHTGDAAPA